MTFASIYHTHLNQALDDFYVELITSLIPVSSHIIDAGCGHGTIAHRLNHLGYQVTGLDNDDDMLCIASTHTNETLMFMKHDLLLPWPVFADAVIMTQDVIHMMKDVKKVIEEALKSISYEGMIIIDMFKEKIDLNATTQFENPHVMYERVSSDDRIFHRYQTEDQMFDFIQYRHDPKEVKALLQSYEFDVVFVESYDEDKVILIATHY